MSRSRRKTKQPILTLSRRSELKTYEADIDRGHFIMALGSMTLRKRVKGAKRFLRARIRRDEKLVARAAIEGTDD